MKRFHTEMLVIFKQISNILQQNLISIISSHIILFIFILFIGKHHF